MSVPSPSAPSIAYDAIGAPVTGGAPRDQRLVAATGSCSRAGADHRNQDALALVQPAAHAGPRPGLAVAIADGIGTSDVSAEAARAAVAGFVADYPGTPTAWSPRAAGDKIITALNAWLHSRTLGSRYRQDMDRGYVCTFSALVAAGRTADLFHIGDTRIYRLVGTTLELLTQDHRVSVAGGAHHLARALGASPNPEIDHQRIAISAGDVFVLATDGAYEAWDEAEVVATLWYDAADLERAAAKIIEDAQARDDRDDASVVVVRFDSVGAAGVDDLAASARALRIPDELAPRSVFEDFTIVRPLSSSGRSRVYLAHPRDAPDTPVAIKTPGVELAGDDDALERFLLEEWIARSIDNPHVLKAHAPRPDQKALYVVFEYIEGQTLEHWRGDQGRPEIAGVRDIVCQVARGLLAFHRREMLHQDIRPANVLVDATGTARIIDFATVRVAGIATTNRATYGVPGTEQFAAPEYFSADTLTPAADQYSLGAMTYYLFTGALPYATQLASATSRSAQQKLRYRPLTDHRPDLPRWLDEAIRRAVHIDPARRYADVACFADALVQAPFEPDTRRLVPWIERDPVRFWQSLCGVLALAVVALGCYIGLN